MSSADDLDKSVDNYSISLDTKLVELSRPTQSYIIFALNIIIKKEKRLHGFSFPHHPV
jgi:hypothetical protein